MPKTVIYPNPDAANVIGAAVNFIRVAAGNTGVQISYNPANGDSPLDSTIALALSAGARTNLAAILVELDTFYRTQRGYTP